VTEARMRGGDVQGLETILQGRGPLDAQQITQRICGVCPISTRAGVIEAQENGLRDSADAEREAGQDADIGVTTFMSHNPALLSPCRPWTSWTSPRSSIQGQEPTLLSAGGWYRNALKDNYVFRGGSVPAAIREQPVHPGRPRRTGISSRATSRR